MQSGTVGFSGVQPTANDIQKSLQSASDPLDFIKKNLRNPDAVVQPVVNNEAAQAAAKVVDNSQNVSNPAEVPPGLGMMAKPADVVATPGKSVVQEAIDNFNAGKHLEQPPKVEEPNSGGAESDPADAATLKEPSEVKEEKGFLKNLRTKVKGLEETLITKETENIEIKTKLEKYEKGEEIPEALKPLQERVKNLEKYEKMYALDTSPEFQELYVEPVNKVKEELGKLVKDYGLSDEVIGEALKIDNLRNLNRFLSDYFDDSIGADHARRLIQDLRQKEGIRENARKDAEGTLNRLLMESSDLRQKSETERVTQVKALARSSWEEGIQEILSTGRYPELTIKDGDDEHNRIAKPILDNAASEYGKVMNLLAAAGLKVIPKEAAKIIAKRFAYSEAAPVIAQSRQHFYEEFEKLVSNGHKTAKYDRPPLGASVNTGSGGSAAPRQPVEPQNAGRMLLKQQGIV